MRKSQIHLQLLHLVLHVLTLHDQLVDPIVQTPQLSRVQPFDQVGKGLLCILLAKEARFRAQHPLLCPEVQHACGIDFIHAGFRIELLQRGLLTQECDWLFQVRFFRLLIRTERGLWSGWRRHWNLVQVYQQNVVPNLALDGFEQLITSLLFWSRVVDRQPKVGGDCLCLSWCLHHFCCSLGGFRNKESPVLVFNGQIAWSLFGLFGGLLCGCGVKLFDWVSVQIVAARANALKALLALGPFHPAVQVFQSDFAFANILLQQRVCNWGYAEGGRLAHWLRPRFAQLYHCMLLWLKWTLLWKLFHRIIGKFASMRMVSVLLDFRRKAKHFV